MVLENMKAGLINDDSSGVFGLGLLVLSYCFMLGSRDHDHSPSVHFSSDGLCDHCHRHPMYKLPIVGSNYFFGIELENVCWLD